MPRVYYIFLGIFAGLAVSSGAFLFLWTLRDTSPEPPIVGKAPAFTLTDAENKTFSSEALRGRVWIAYFFFTSCAGPCPILNRNVSRLMQEFAESPNFHAVGFSVDPETDTPEVLAKYGERYGADTSRWHMLTGPIEKITDLADHGFLVGGGETPLIHSTKFVLVDAQGNVRGYYDGTDDEEVAQLRNAVRRLLS
jgi:protein SCO1/2